MTTNKSFHGKERSWVAPKITKLAIATETKSAAVANQTTPSEPIGHRVRAAEPQLPSPPKAKFGFAIEWSFPLSARTE